MRRFISILVVVLTVLAVANAGVREDFKANPKLSANNYQAYPTSGFPALTAAPDGYEPFFINHYGRHGSRWLIQEKKYTYPLQMLEKGERNGKLTRRGQEVLDVLRQVHEASKGRLGELSDIGAEQHQGIARRMFQNFPQVFKDGAPVVARSTVVIRCILSMTAACEELTAFNPRLKIHNDASESLQWYMNARATKAVRSAVDKRGDVVDRYRNKLLRPERFCRQLFNDEAYMRDSVDQQELMRRTFSVCCNMQSHDDGLNLWSLFNEDECYDLWRTYNIKWYTELGNSPLTNGVGPFRQKNLLQNMIETADTIVGKKKYHGATLRFGHESVVLPFASLLELGETAERVENLDTLDRVWASYRIFPMACNVQLVFYRPKKGRDGDILVKALLNEREVSMPVEPVKFPYYRWEDLRTYYTAKLQRYADY